MPLGILEPRDRSVLVPGTENIDARKNAIKEISSKLKKDGDIVLVPQPTDDPNDPLNWSTRKKDCILGVLCLISLIASTLSPLLAANTVELSIYFQQQFGTVALLTGYHLLAVGLAGFLFVASARLYGKRHLYLIGTLFIIASSAWGGFATPHANPEEKSRSYTWLIVVRVLQGVGLAPFEALVNATVGDMYFVHQRGLRMAASNMALFGGAFFTPIVVGKITYTIGWWWTFWLIAIFAGAIFPLIFFYCPETTYNRPDYKDLEGDLNTIRQYYASNQDSDAFYTPAGSSANSTKEAATIKNGAPNIENGAASHVTGAPIPSKKSYWRSLLPFDQKYSNENPLKLILRPFPLFLHPAILWACLIQGAMIGWTVMMAVVLAAIFLGPPLWFNEVTTGYMYTGPFLGAIFGFILSGWFSDASTRWMIKANHGIYEPEFRMLLVGPQLIFGALGLYGFGWAAQNVQPGGYAIPDVFFAFEVVAMINGAVASSLYIVDAYRDIQVEAFTCLLIFKNVFSFSLTYKAYDWVTHSNSANGLFMIFVALGSVQVVICLTTIPMWIFGKRNRAFMHKHDLLKLFKLK